MFELHRRAVRIAAALPVYMVSSNRIMKHHTNTTRRDANVAVEMGSTALTMRPIPARNDRHR